MYGYGYKKIQYVEDMTFLISADRLLYSHFMNGLIDLFISFSQSIPDADDGS